jgi:hypothetical protein
MSSNINPNNINGNFPVAGQDNDSQGFRDNFTNILNNFSFASTEITNLQNTVTNIQSWVPSNGNIQAYYGNVSQGLTVGGNLSVGYITTAAGSGANLIIDPDGNADLIINSANVWLNAGYLRSTATNFQLANIYPISANLFGNATSVIIGNVAGNVQARGNIVASNFLFANGVSLVSTISVGGTTYSNSNVSSYLTANPQPGTYSNSTVASYLPVYSGNISGTNILAQYSIISNNIFANANVQTGNLIATTVSASGNVGVAGGSVFTTASTAYLMNQNATTVNAFGAATTINIGNASGNTNITGFLTVSSAIQFANLTTTQINAITPTNRGMTVFNYTTGNVQVYNGTKWANIALS